MLKKELEAEVARLAEENKGMRELLAAISAVAGTVPIAKDDNAAEWRRSVHVLANISYLAKVDDGWDGFLAYAAGELRAVAAAPVGYEVYASPENEMVVDAKRLLDPPEQLTVAERARRGAAKAEARRGQNGGVLLPAACDPDNAPEEPAPVVRNCVAVCRHCKRPILGDGQCVRRTAPLRCEPYDLADPTGVAL